MLLLVLVGFTFLPRGGWGPHLEAAAHAVRERTDALLPERWRSSGDAPALASAWEWSGDGLIGKLLHRDLELPPDAPPQAVAFTADLKKARNCGRLALVGLLGLFAGLVAWAGRKPRT